MDQSTDTEEFIDYILNAESMEYNTDSSATQAFVDNDVIPKGVVRIFGDDIPKRVKGDIWYPMLSQRTCHDLRPTAPSAAGFKAFLRKHLKESDSCTSKDNALLCLRQKMS
mmetsp:Transcript_5915/g.7747  ORF Transcript_5915/g.7747 Transcript_5915/m.7747 type:complete len:111 (-) Transcript_5915:91-423(-)